MHIGQQFTKDPIAQHIELLVAPTDALGQSNIATHKRIKGIFYHGLSQLGHKWNVNKRLEQRHRIEHLGALDNVDGLIVYAL